MAIFSTLSSRTWNNNSLLLEKLFKGCRTVVEWLRQVSKVKPGVKHAGWHVVHCETKLLEELEYVVSLALEVTLKGKHSLFLVTQKGFVPCHSEKKALTFLSSYIQGQGEVSPPLAI